MYRLVLILALLEASQAFSQDKLIRYTLSGYLTNLKNQTVYLIPGSQASRFRLNPDSHVSKLDSAQTLDGHFSFQGSIPEETYVALAVQSRQRGTSKAFLLDAIPVTIIGDADSMTHLSVLGSPAIQHQALLDKSVEALQKELTAVERLRLESIQRGDKTRDSLLGRQGESLRQEIAAVQAEFIGRHPDSWASLFTLQSLLRDLPQAKAQALWLRLAYPLQQHSVGRQIHEQVFDKVAEPRQYTPNLILSDQQSKPVSLLAYQGKVVLIDFWASWCDHCRQEHTRLKSLYNQYKDKGLQIVSISVDEDPKAWKKALQKAKLPWVQLSDRVGSRNVVGTQYGSNAIPINLMIDKDGFIIRKGLHGAELEKQLALALSTP